MGVLQKRKRPDGVDAVGPVSCEIIGLALVRASRSIVYRGVLDEAAMREDPRHLWC
jgi:hypothetical protein